ncbi:Peptidyl-prolyl cis-trans isomerase D (PPIase D) (Rotamase D) [Durusdinium trenchii]|uniref:Peptidyl-prolyl cis-trans isomerase n=1 Tax=Durusdinium trenchii TaxID=1381693 RepID=A0ABP0SS38_9DINO
MVDYSKFSKIEDSDDEPIWQTQAPVKSSKVSEKVLQELDLKIEKLQTRSRFCHCFLDFAVDVEKLKIYAQEMEDAGAKLPKSRYLGRVVVELDQAAFAPKLCENFRLLCTGEQGTGVRGQRLSYQGRHLDYILPKYCIQASVPDEFSCWGSYLPDENLVLPQASFDKPGVLAVGNHGPDTNSCTFMITLNEASHLDGFNQIIGHVVRGLEVLRMIEGFPTDRKVQSFAERNVKSHWGGRPMVDVIIESCGEMSEELIVLK